ncbi:MAG: TolC family protein [Myxococcales bacterium]
MNHDVKVRPCRRRGRVLLAWACLLTVLCCASNAVANWPPLELVVARARSRALIAVDARGALRSAQAAAVGARVSRLQNPYFEIFGDRGAYTHDVQIQSNLWLPIEVGTQRPARIDEANALVDWRGRSLVDAEARAVGEAVYSYGAVLVASARLSEAERGEDEANVEARYVSGRLDAGDATLFDQGLAEAEVGRWSQLRAEAGLELVQARARLEVLVGLPQMDRPPEAPCSAPTLRQPGDAVRSPEIVSQSPLVRLLAAEAVYWEANRKRTVAEAYAPLNFVLSLNRGDYGETRAGGAVAWTFPITRRNQGEAARAEAEHTRVTDLEGALRATITVRLRAAYETLAGARTAIEHVDSTTLPAAQRVVLAATEGRKAGKVDPVRVVIARRDLAVARSRRLDLVLIAWRAYGEIAALRGQLP